MPIIEQSAGIDFAADVNVALAYNKLCDDIADERGRSAYAPRWAAPR